MGKKDKSSPRQPSHSGIIAYRTTDGVSEVLLVTASGSGRWVIPKGHIVEDVGSRESARREAFEEAGIEGEVEATSFRRYAHGEDEAIVEVFLMRVTSESASWPEEKVRERRWVPFGKTDELVDDPGLKRLLRKAAKRVGGSSTWWPARGPKRVPAAGLVAASILIALVLFAGTGLWRRGDTAMAISAGDKKSKTPATATADGACQFGGGPVTLPEDLTEASGVAASSAHAGILWTHNDTGDPFIYAIDYQGNSKARIPVTGARAVDWEGVDLGPCPAGQCLYIGDIGDNNASRSEIVVYRVTEPSPGDIRTAPAEALRARYPDGPSDAEALFVTLDGGIYIVTKGETGPVNVYRFPTAQEPGSVGMLERVRVLTGGKPSKNDRITGADVSADGDWIVLRSARNLAFYKATDFSGSSAPVREMPLKTLKEPQGEGVAFGATSRTIFLIGEGGKKGNPGTLATLTCALE